MNEIFEVIIAGWKGREFSSAFPLHIRLLLRSSVILAHVAAILKFGKTFGMLSHEKKVQLLEILYYHRSPMVRNVVQWWKLTALMLQNDQ